MMLERHPWPGNVRELKNVLERAIVLAGAPGRIEPIHLQLPEMPPPTDSARELGGPSDTIPPTPYGSPPGIPGTYPPPNYNPMMGNQPPPPATGSNPHLGAMTPAMGIPHLGAMHTPQPQGQPYPQHAQHSPSQPMPPPGSGPGGAQSDLKAQRESWEKQQILQALERTSGNQKEAAKLLGVSRRTLINKIEAYGIARPRKR